VNDAMWIADLLADGLIRSNFVPPQAIQQLRDLTRTASNSSGRSGAEQLWGQVGPAAPGYLANSV
jgi:hypothetical protein